MQLLSMPYHRTVFSRRNSRKGVSFVEFVGCLTALAGGMVLGSIYLGVDVQTMAVGILEKSDIEVPSILHLKTEVGEEASHSNTTKENTKENTPQNVTDEATTSAVEPGLEVVEDEPAKEKETVERPELNDAEKLAATQACWFALNQCVQEEAANRSKSIRDPGNWQLFDYLLHRKEGHQLVVETIEQIDLHGVDPRLLAHVQQILTWHRAGADLFDRSTQLLSDAPAGKLTGPFAQSWQSAATQHRMEEKLIFNKHAAIESYLEHANKMSAAK